MGILRELVAKFVVGTEGSEKLEKADSILDRLKKTSEGTKKALKEMAPGLVGLSAGFAAAMSFARAFSAEAKELSVTARRLSLTTDQVQVLGEYARGAGAGVEEMNTALSILSEKVGEAATHTGQGGEVFSRFHIRVKEANGSVRGLYDILGDVADRIQRAKSRAEQFAIAQQLFGRQGRVLVDVLSRGSAELRKAEEEFRALGGGLSQASIIAGTQFGGAMHRASFVTQAFKSSIAVELLPALSWLVNKFVLVSAWLARTTIATNVTRIAMGAWVAYGVVQISRIARAISAASSATKLLMLKWLLAAAGVVVLTVVLDDLIGMLTGANSVTGELIDSLYGVGTTVEIVREFNNLLQDTVYLIREAADAWNDFFNGPVAEGHIVNPRTGQTIRHDGAAQGREAVTSESVLSRRRRAGNGGPPRLVPGMPDMGPVGTNPTAINPNRESAAFLPQARRVPVPTVDPRFAGSGPFQNVNAPLPAGTRNVPLGDLAGRSGGGSHVSVTTPVNVTIQGSTDPRQAARETRREVTTAVREATAQQVRELQSSGLVFRSVPPGEQVEDLTTNFPTPRRGS